MLCALGVHGCCVGCCVSFLINVSVGRFSFHALMADGHQEALKVSTALRADGFLQRHVVFLQVHVLNRLQVDLGHRDTEQVMGDRQ